MDTDESITGVEDSLEPTPLASLLLLLVLFTFTACDGCPNSKLIKGCNLCNM